VNTERVKEKKKNQRTAWVGVKEITAENRGYVNLGCIQYTI